MEHRKESQPKCEPRERCQLTVKRSITGDERASGVVKQESREGAADWIGERWLRLEWILAPPLSHIKQSAKPLPEAWTNALRRALSTVFPLSIGRNKEISSYRCKRADDGVNSQRDKEHATDCFDLLQGAKLRVAMLMCCVS